MTLMMTSAQVVETSVNVTNNSPSQDYSHLDDQTTQTTETPGFKPFTIVIFAEKWKISLHNTKCGKIEYHVCTFFGAI